MQSMALGKGGRFQKLEKSLSGQKGIYNPAGLAAAIGRKKYGKKRFQKMGLNERIASAHSGH